jgi:hypothetical protein
MATTDATPFPVKNEAYRFYFSIRSSTTGNPITGGLTTLACTLSKDGASFVSSTNSPVEIGTTGYGYVDLTAAECNYSAVTIQVTAANANAVYAQGFIVFQRETATTTGAVPTDLYTNALWARQLMANAQSAPNLPGASGTVTVYAVGSTSTSKWTRSITVGTSTNILSEASRS